MAEDESVEEELREMAAEELGDLEGQRDTLVKEVLVAMIPPDATDSRNSVMEIRGGAGGRRGQYFCRRPVPHV